MNWFETITKAIDCMEDNICENLSPDEVAKHVNMSGMYLQRGFQIVTGYTLGEYMRNRRLYMAAIDLINSDISVTGLAMKYCYDTPASFDKAFVRFHEASPTEVRRGEKPIKSFLRLKVSIALQGGENMQFTIEKKDAIKVVGFKREFPFENSYETIPAFWDEMTAKYAEHLMRGQMPEGEIETYIAEHHIGELGVCIDDLHTEKFEYMIAGYYSEDEVPDCMEVREIAAGTWAVFDCTLGTLQKVNDAIWKEWIPANSEYELAGKYNIEWYSTEDEPGPNQRTQIWIPVKSVD